MKEHHAADQLPPPTEKIEGDLKIVTEYKFDDGKKVKTTKTYQIIKNEVTKGVLKRRQWRPFGKLQTEEEKRETATDEEIFMQFINQKDTETVEDDPWAKALEANKSLFKCRVCAGNHATAQCPLGSRPDELANDMANLNLSRLNTTTENKYIPRPQLMEQSGRPSVSMSQRLREDMNTIRVTNLPGEMQDSDIKDLFGPIGRISRIFLARDKYTGTSRGYAFVSYEKHEHAQAAVKTFNGYGYANLILKVELARPS